MEPIEWRKRNNLSQAAVAAMLGCTAATISRLETRKTHPSPEIVRGYARISNGAVMPADFYGDITQDVDDVQSSPSQGENHANG